MAGYLTTIGDANDLHLLKTMTMMIETHPDATVTMASSNAINVSGDGIGDFLQELVNQVPVLNMKYYQSKSKSNSTFVQCKHKRVDRGVETHCIQFTFYELDYRKRMNIPPNQPVR